MAVAGGGDADQPLRIELERVEIMLLRSRGHGGGALAGGEADHASPGGRAQMLRQHDIGMRSGDGSVENGAQERASVGHDVLGNSGEGWGHVVPLSNLFG